MIKVHAEGVRGYNEDQVALVKPDATTFGSWVPVILGTPTINRVINVIKESEIDELSASLNVLRIALLVGMSASRAFYQKQHYCSPCGRSNQFEWSSQDNQEGKNTCFFI